MKDREELAVIWYKSVWCCVICLLGPIGLPKLEKHPWFSDAGCYDIILFVWDLYFHKLENHLQKFEAGCCNIFRLLGSVVLQMLRTFCSNLLMVGVMWFAGISDPQQLENHLGYSDITFCSIFCL